MPVSIDSGWPRSENQNLRSARSFSPSRRGFLTAAAASAAVTAAPLAFPGTAVSLETTRQGLGRPELPQSPDIQLRALCRAIDPQRIGDSIQALIDFGTRHTLSSQDDPNRGIGAAANWIFDQLQ